MVEESAIMEFVKGKKPKIEGYVIRGRE